ncbi:MAG: hypothetical protein R2794_10535 [Chitinophagales bacterium]
MEIETIRIAGLTISEPVTSFTDVILAIISIALCIRIRVRMHESYFTNAWRFFFLFMGLSTGIGAVAHGIGTLHSAAFSTLWMVMNLCCSVAVYWALRATILFTRITPPWNKIFQAVNVGTLISFIGLTLFNNDFEIFKIHAAVGLFLIFLTHLIAYFRSHQGSGWIVSGMLLSFLTVLIHTRQISISNWFNYKDISHVIMMGSLLLIYGGIYRMSRNLRLSVFRSSI